MQVPPVHQAHSVEAPDRAGKVQEAARDFEALLIAQMLTVFRAESASGCFGSGDDTASATMLEFAGQHLAQVISRQGGLGLHHLIIQGLTQQSESSGEAEGSKPGFVNPEAGQSAAVSGRTLPTADQLLPGAR